MLSSVEDEREVEMETPVDAVFYLPDIPHQMFESSRYYAQVMTQVMGDIIRS